MAQQVAHIVFAGPPDAMEALVPIAPVARRSIRVEFDDLRMQPTVLTAPAGDEATLVRLVASQQLPPGTHYGRLQGGESEFAVRIDVAGLSSITIRPPSFSFTCGAGSEDQIEITIENLGNQPLTLRRLYAVGLLEEGAIETAIGSALRTRRRVGRSRVDYLADELADRYGGTARLRLEGIDGTIAPGTAARLTARIRLRDGRPNRRYHGLWLLADAKVPIWVTTTAELPIPEPQPTPEPAPSPKVTESPPKAADRPRQGAKK